LPRRFAPHGVLDLGLGSILGHDMLSRNAMNLADGGGSIMAASLPAAVFKSLCLGLHSQLTVKFSFRKRPPCIGYVETARSGRLVK
jgi:hypothetical protein